MPGAQGSGELDVRGPEEREACVQLAARWAEMYTPAEDANKGAALLERFRIAQAFIDAVIHGIEPPGQRL